MKLNTLLAAALFTASTLSAAASHATEYLTGTLGWYDVTQQDDEAVSYGAEYRFEPFYHGLRPIIGVFGTSDESVYGYAGFQWDILIANQVYLSPNLAAGAYSHGDGKELGGAIEFRSGIELGYEFANRHRLGVAFNHMSNASIYDHNPGVENLLVTYSLPTGNIFYK